MFSLFESLQFCKLGYMQRKDLIDVLLNGKLFCAFKLLSTLHCMLTKLNRGQVNHATHERQGLTKHILSILLLLEYSLFKKKKKTTKKWRSVVHSLKKKTTHTHKKKNNRKINRLNTHTKIPQSEGRGRHCSKSILFYAK